MTRDDILDAIRTLARSQGFYGRLLDAICEADDDARDEFLDTLEDQHFNDMLDLVMFLEC